MANVSNAAVVSFPQNGGSLQNVSYFGLGFALSGNGVLYASGALTPARDIAGGSTPKFEIGELDVNLTTTSSQFEAAFLQNVLKLYFQNLDHANVGDAAGVQNSGTEGSIYISLHTANPAGGNQATSEATYTGYARQAIARNSGAFTVA